MLRCAVYKRYHIIFSTYSSSSATCVFRKRSFIILTSHFGHVTSYELKKTTKITYSGKQQVKTYNKGRFQVPWVI